MIHVKSINYALPLLLNYVLYNLVQLSINGNKLVKFNYQYMYCFLNVF